MRSFVYLAIPYSHASAEVREQRMQRFAEEAARIEHEGAFHVVSGVMATSITSRVPLPDDYAFWGSYSEALVRICARMIVLRLDGWETSIGVAGEIKVAESLAIPIDYL